MPYLAVGKDKFYYETQGSGPPLILISGYACDLSCWGFVKEALASHFQLVLFDNRGVGRTEESDEHFTLEKMAEDVICIAEALKLKKPAVLGHSMGGSIVQILGHRFKEKIGKTIISQSVVKLIPAARATLEAQLHLLQDQVQMKRIAELVIPWLFSDPLIENPAFCQEFIRLQVENPIPLRPQGLIKQYEALIQFDSRPWYHKIETAPLILAGDQDRLCPLSSAQEMAACIPHARLHVFEGVGHIAHIERPQEFCQVVHSYLLEER